MPLRGLADLWTASVGGRQIESEVPGAFGFIVVLVAAATLAIVAGARTRKPLALAAVGYGLVSVCLNYEKIWAHLPSGERGTVELFVCLLLCLLNGPQSTRLSNALVAFFFVVAVYAFAFSPEASISRSALLVLR